jgi:hypothetical protein
LVTSLYGRHQSCAHEGQLAFLPKGVLDRGGQLSKLADLFLVDLVQGDEQTRTVLGQNVAEQFDLGAQTGFDHVGLNGAPAQATSTQRSAEPAEAAPDSFGVKGIEQPGKVLAGQPPDEAGRGCLADHHPAHRLGPVLDGVEHHGLA